MKIATLVLMGLTPLAGVTSLAQDSFSPRLQIGINLLPAVIAANNNLGATSATGKLPIYLVYRNNRHFAEQLIPALGRIGVIRKRVVEIRPISLDELLELEIERASAIFIAEPLDFRLQNLVEFAQRQRVLLFSPFKGDVKLGVPTGFQVTDKVLPLVNMASLKQSGIQLKAFFLRIAVKHE